MGHPRDAARLLAALDRDDGDVVAQLLGPEVVQSALPRMMARGEVLEARFERDGTIWRTDLGDEIGWSVWRSGAYEELEISAVLGWLASNGRRDGWIIDAGANIGTTSIPFARYGYQVLAIEPVPNTFAMLQANVTENDLAAAIVCSNMAITDTEGTVEMWTGFGSGQAELVVEGRVPAMERWGSRGSLVSVPAAPLSSLMAEHAVEPDQVSLVWADIQGAETDLIKSARDLWEAGVPLYLEVDPDSLDIKAGLTQFVSAVCERFGHFVPRDDLLVAGPPRPISGFREWVETIGSGSYSDALLVP